MDDDPYENPRRPDTALLARVLPDRPLDPLLVHIGEAIRLARDLNAGALAYRRELCEDEARELAGSSRRGRLPRVPDCPLVDPAPRRCSGASSPS